MKLITLSLFLSALFTSAAWAGPEELSRAYERCIDESGGVTVLVGNCINQEHSRQDARLNVSYKKLMDSLEGDRKSKLLNAQRAWLKFRDAHGDFLLAPDGGTLDTIEAQSWKMQATADRARQLEDYSH